MHEKDDVEWMEMVWQHIFGTEKKETERVASIT